jgi:hypothetical protein
MSFKDIIKRTPSDMARTDSGGLDTDSSTGVTTVCFFCLLKFACFVMLFFVEFYYRDVP